MAGSAPQQTLVIVKPDGVQRGVVGTIIDRFERRGLKIVAMRMLQIDRELAERHYGVHRGRPFFEGLVSYITSSPVVVAVLEGRNAVAVVRTTMGATDAAEAAPGTIRGDLALEIGRNLVHGSDSEESARHEIGLFFRPDEIVSYGRSVDGWISEE
jgi:nucleoside-diphosphate kinase